MFGSLPIDSIVDDSFIEHELAAHHVTAIRQEERRLLDDVIRDASGLLLFGAGNLGRRTLSGLRDVGVEPLAFVDSAAHLHGEAVDGLRVLELSTAAQRFPDALFVVTIWSPSRMNVIAPVLQAIRSFGVAKACSFVPLYWRFAEVFLPYHSLDLPHCLYEEAVLVRRAYECFTDDESRLQFRIQLSYLLSAMDGSDIPRRGGSYFPADLMSPGASEVFLDCGAYDGDSLHEFLAWTEGSFAAAYCFEPDPLAFDGLDRFVASLPERIRNRVTVDSRALGSREGVVSFDADGTPGSRVTDTGKLSVPMTTIDNLRETRAPTIIKMDIEGAEREALAGARRTVRESRPILAICVYHLQDDLFRLPLAIAQATEQYRLFLRRQGDSGDLVCFAVPYERIPQ